MWSGRTSKIWNLPCLPMFSPKLDTFLFSNIVYLAFVWISNLLKN